MARTRLGARKTAADIGPLDSAACFSDDHREDRLRKLWAMRGIRLLLFSLIALVAAQVDAAPPREVTIFVSSNGWHTGLHLPVAELRAQVAFPLPAWARSYDWIEIGWGAREFYMRGRPDVVLAARTLFTPNPSVLHVVGVPGMPAAYFPHAQVRPLRLTPAQFAVLSAKIGAHFERDARGAPVVLGRGLYGDARFYAARGFYYFPKTCNVWTARQLRDAGLPFCPALSTASGAVMMQARMVERRQKAERMEDRGWQRAPRPVP